MLEIAQHFQFTEYAFRRDERLEHVGQLLQGDTTSVTRIRYGPERENKQKIGEKKTNVNIKMLDVRLGETTRISKWATICFWQKYAIISMRCHCGVDGEKKTHTHVRIVRVNRTWTRTYGGRPRHIHKDGRQTYHSRRTHFMRFDDDDDDDVSQQVCCWPCRSIRVSGRRSLCGCRSGRGGWATLMHTIPEKHVVKHILRVSNDFLLSMYILCRKLSCRNICKKSAQVVAAKT